MQKNIKRAAGILGAILLGAISFACNGDNNGDDNFVQVDRMGMPVVNTALIPSSMKDAFNSGDPADDPSDFLDIMVARIEELRAAVAAVPGFPPEDAPGVPAADVAALVNPDVLRIDLSMPTVFPNGRGLNDDTIDPILGLVLNRGNVLGGGPGVSDGVANDSPALNVFPYAAPPQ